MIGIPIPARDHRPAYLQMHPTWTHGVMLPSCGELGCKWGLIDRRPEMMGFVHDSPRRFSVIELTEDKMLNLDYDVWGSIILPAIERFHAEAQA